MQHKKSEKGINNIYWFATSCLSLQSRIQHTDSMIEAHFNNIRNLIINNIRTAQSEIKIAVAWFTQKELFEAVMNALERGVKVSLIMMKDFINCGIYGLPLQGFVDKGGNLHFVSNRGWTMHNKFCLFDNRVVISGSYNWTYSAETRNAENVIATDDEIVCSRFDDYFNQLWEESFAEEKVSNVEISSEEVVQNFSVIQDELEAMVENAIVPQDMIMNLKKTKDNADAIVAKITIPAMLPLIPSEPVRFGNRTLKPGESIMLKTIALQCADGNPRLANRGETLPISIGSVFTYNEEGADKEEFIINKLSFSNSDSLKLFCFENLPPSPAGKLKFKVSMSISENGLLSFHAFCYCSGESKKTEIQLVEGEDFIIGK